MFRVEKYLKSFYIGDVCKDEDDNIDNDQSLTNDFKQLRQKAISKVDLFLFIFYLI